jgi:hypothetical protein
MSKASILLLFSAIFCAFVHCTYTTLDGSQFIPLSYSPNIQYDAREIVTQENINQDMLSYYSWFGSYGYCEDVDIPLLCCKNFTDFFTNKWTMVAESSTTKYFNYNFVIWRNDEYKKYVFAFPGTRNNIIELLNEAANIKLVNYDDIDNGIQVVNYFYKVAIEIRSLIFTTETLNDFYAHPGYQYIFVGHSLGGAVAAIELYDALNKKFISQDSNPALITYGMPRTGNEKWVIDFNTKFKNILRVVRNGDIVSSLPFLPINNPYRHLGGLVLVNKEMNSMNYCPKDIGEDYPDKECVREISVDIKYHTKYFNPDVLFSHRCR